MTNCKECGSKIDELIEIPELKIKITKVIHKNLSYDEIMKLKKENQRLLTINEAIFIINNKKYSKLLDIFSGNNDFFIEQPFEINKKNNYVAGLVAYPDGAWVNCVRHPDIASASLGVIFAEDVGK